MKNKKWEIFFVALVLTALLVQGWTNRTAENTETAAELEAQQLEKQIADLQEQLDQLDQEVAMIDQEVEKEKSRISRIDSEREGLLDQIEAEEKAAGLKAIDGEGLTIKIIEPERPYVQGETTAFLVYNPEYILSLISEINQADVEGIAINGIRYTNYSSLRGNQDCLILDQNLLCDLDGSGLTTIILTMVGSAEEIMDRIDFQGSTLGYLRDSIGLTIISESGPVYLPNVDRLPEPEFLEALE
ncbi:hypothetical protein SANA_22310 [Gottschalkiaceae bacterium SANA]|nr:hypothetical protein SANA_22310 [Gottschalkiaceae bacterium SANA]